MIAIATVRVMCMVMCMAVKDEFGVLGAAVIVTIPPPHYTIPITVTTITATTTITHVIAITVMITIISP